MNNTVLILVLFCLVSVIYTQNNYYVYQNWKGLSCSGQPIRPPSRGKTKSCTRTGSGYESSACNGTHVIYRSRCADTGCRSCGRVEISEIGKCYPIRQINQSSKYLRCEQAEESK
eukprot:gene9680-1886_t